jgi:hypothetical protein
MVLNAKLLRRCPSWSAGRGPGEGELARLVSWPVRFCARAQACRAWTASLQCRDIAR